MSSSEGDLARGSDAIPSRNLWLPKARLLKQAESSSITFRFLTVRPRKVVVGVCWREKLIDVSLELQLAIRGCHYTEGEKKWMFQERAEDKTVKIILEFFPPSSHSYPRPGYSYNFPASFWSGQKTNKNSVFFPSYISVICNWKDTDWHNKLSHISDVKQVAPK